MIYRNSISIRGISLKPLFNSSLVFNNSFPLFNSLKLKTSPRSPRSGNSGSYSQFILAETEKAGNKIAETAIQAMRKRLSIFLILENTSTEKGIPQNPIEFREFLRIKQFTGAKRVRQSLQVNSRSLLKSNSPVKSYEVCGDNSACLKGTKKAPSAGSYRNPLIPVDFLQSFKSCRGHHFEISRVLTGWQELLPNSCNLRKNSTYPP